MAIIALYLISYFKIFLVDLALFAKVVTMNFEWHLRTFCRQIHQCTVGGFKRPILALTKFGKRLLPLEFRRHQQIVFTFSPWFVKRIVSILFESTVLSVKVKELSGLKMRISQLCPKAVTLSEVG